MGIYVDIGIGIIFLIALIVGIVKGFAKQFSKGLCGLIGFIGSIGLTIILVPLIAQTGVFKSVAHIMSDWYTADYFKVTVESPEALVEVLSQGLLKILSSLSGRIWATMELFEINTLGGYFGILTAKAILGVILWILLLLAIKYAFLGIKKLMEKLATLPVLHTLDKLFGALWSVGITYIIVTCFIITLAEIVIIKWTPSAQPTLEEIVSTSYVFQFIHGTNVIGSFVASLFNVDLLTIAPIA